jgi:hypothetical protein
MLVDGLQDALALRLRRFRRPVKGPDLEAAAVVQFQQFGHQQAHGVHVQVTRQVGHLDAAAARWCQRVQRHGRRLGHLFVDEALRAQQLQHRVVAQAHGGQQRGAQQELVGRDLAHRQVVRPGALLLPDVDVVLDHVALPRLELQAAAHQRFALGVAAQHFQQPRSVVQRVQAVFQRHRRLGVEDLAPLRHGAGGVTPAFQHMAQVQAGRHKTGLQGQRTQVGGLGLGHLVGADSSVPQLKQATGAAGTRCGRSRFHTAQPRRPAGRRSAGPARGPSRPARASGHCARRPGAPVFQAPEVAQARLRQRRQWHGRWRIPSGYSRLHMDAC